MPKIGVLFCPFADYVDGDHVDGPYWSHTMQPKLLGIPEALIWAVLLWGPHTGDMLVHVPVSAGLRVK